MYSHTQKQTVTLPKGLIGAKCTAQVTIDNKDLLVGFRLSSNNDPQLFLFREPVSLTYEFLE